MTGPGGNPMHAWIDASAGVAGDMLLGALLDAGADITLVQQAIDLVIPGSVRLDRTSVARAGQRATKIDVAVLVQAPPQRSWRSIQALLTRSELTESTRDRAVAVFARLAEAEGQVHGIPAADVHFHEVGALDSIADVVGVCAALTDLGITSVSAGEVAVGSGRVRSAHGDLPVPVPAVARLAIGWRVNAAGSGELATPTGMALVTALAQTCENLPSLTVRSVGVGAGSKDTDGRPNVTRVIVGEPAAVTRRAAEAALLLETNVDDQDPRLWPAILTHLLEAGAADAWLTPILMKKGRPAHTLSVLCEPGRVEALRELIFTDTSTIGVREHHVDKHALDRLWYDIALGEDTVAVKVAHRGGSIVQVTPEFDSVTALAASRVQPARVVLDAAIAAAANAGLTDGAPLPHHGRSSRSDHRRAGQDTAP